MTTGCFKPPKSTSNPTRFFIRLSPSNPSRLIYAVAPVGRRLFSAAGPVGRRLISASATGRPPPHLCRRSGRPPPHLRLSNRSAAAPTSTTSTSTDDDSLRRPHPLKVYSTCRLQWCRRRKSHQRGSAQEKRVQVIPCTCCFSFFNFLAMY